MERRGLGMVLGCGSPPLLAVVRIDVSRETIPLMERILLVAPLCFTWNIGISTSNILRAYSRVLWKASVSLYMFKFREFISEIGGVCLSCLGAGLRFPGV